MLGAILQTRAVCTYHVAVHVYVGVILLVPGVEETNTTNSKKRVALNQNSSAHVCMFSWFQSTLPGLFVPALTTTTCCNLSYHIISRMVNDDATPAEHLRSRSICTSEPQIRNERGSFPSCCCCSRITPGTKPNNIKAAVGSLVVRSELADRVCALQQYILLLLEY